MTFPLHPPRSWFLDKPAWFTPGMKITPITEGPEAGRVAGYVAPWGQCLLGGNPQECFTAPSSPTGYAAAMQGETITADGEPLRTANIGGGINHAPVRPATFSRQVVDHYANTASQLMRVVYHEDDYGIFALGALWPEVTERDIATIRASALSGDWRWRPELQAHDMAGSQLVNTPGFPLIRAVPAACSAHPILVGGMGGVPADMLEVTMPDDPTTPLGQAFADGITANAPAAAAAGQAVAAACSCQGGDAPAEELAARLATAEGLIADLRARIPAPATAATTDVTPESPETPAQEPAPPTAEESRQDEVEQRLADVEDAIRELGDGVAELRSWLAEMAAEQVDMATAEAAALPPSLAAMPPQFRRDDGAESRPHEFVDEDGDGKCDVCGKAEDAHDEQVAA